jgi:signal peptidase II
VTRRQFFIFAGIALSLDQATKIAVRALLPEGRSVNLLGTYLRIFHGRNEHGVFGIQYGPQFIYYVLPVIGSLAVLWLGWRARDRWSATALGLVLGGAIGNLVDRIYLGGRVVDFIDMGTRDWRWFTYNLADACLVVGIVMLLVRELLMRPKHTSEPPPTPPSAPGT